MFCSDSVGQGPEHHFYQNIGNVRTTCLSVQISGTSSESWQITTTNNDNIKTTIIDENTKGMSLVFAQNANINK